MAWTPAHDTALLRVFEPLAHDTDVGEEELATIAAKTLHRNRNACLRRYRELVLFREKRDRVTPSGAPTAYDVIAGMHKPHQDTHQPVRTKEVSTTDSSTNTDTPVESDVSRIKELLEVVQRSNTRYDEMLSALTALTDTVNTVASALKERQEKLDGASGATKTKTTRKRKTPEPPAQPAQPAQQAYPVPMFFPALHGGRPQQPSPTPFPGAFGMHFPGMFPFCPQ